MKPEEQTRQDIDDKLQKANWIIQDRQDINLGAGPGIAIREFSTKAGPVDFTKGHRRVDLDINQFEKDYLDEIGLIPEIISRYRSTYFMHIVGGYAAGYYGYIWSEVLDCDAFEAFKETSLFDQKTVNAFKTSILEKNGTADYMSMYINFRGREPKIEPLLKKRGFQ